MGELELLHINSSKKIDLGIKVNTSYTYKLKFKDTDVSNWEAYIGTTNSQTYCARDAMSNNLHASNMAKNLDTVPSTPTELIVNFTSAAGSNIWLGSVQNTGVPNAEYDFYYLQVYSGDELINNFVPVREVATNKIGLLDKVTNTFIEY